MGTTEQTTTADPVVAVALDTCDTWARTPRKVALATTSERQRILHRNSWRLSIAPDMALLSPMDAPLPEHWQPLIDIRYTGRILSLATMHQGTSQVRAFDAPPNAPVAQLELFFPQLAAAIARNREAADRHASVLCHAILSAALEHALHPTSTAVGKAAKKRQTFFRLDAFIRDNLNRQSGVKDAANHLAMSPQYLNRVCKAFRGLSYSRYVNLRRLERGRRLLLASPKCSIAETAAQCGFKSPAYFIRNFREQYGLPPSRLRKELRSRRTKATPNLHTVLGFERLHPLMDRPLASGPDRLPQLTVIIINNSQNLIEVDWLSPEGVMTYQGQLAIGMRWILGTAKHSVLQLRNGEHHTFYQAGNQNCQILV